MFFRAKSLDEVRQLADDVARAMDGRKTRILLRGGPMDGTKVDLSQMEIDQGMMASCHMQKGKIVQGEYQPSDELSRVCSDTLRCDGKRLRSNIEVSTVI
jgi:hypothetical protein